MISERTVVVLGLPASGKTTFLAALWHLISAREIDTALKFGSLRAGQAAHLNEIATRWRQAKKQERTSVAGDRIVSMQLVGEDDQALTVSFPDVAGEAFLEMWERRECEEQLADLLKTQGVMFFIHSDNINSPGWVVDDTEVCKALKIEYRPGQYVPWKPLLAPTQVQVVDLLQSLHMPPLDIGQRRLAIMLSAWDKAETAGVSPTEYLEQELPLLAQYLRSGLPNNWDVRIYGISAQGGEYDTDGKTGGGQVEELRAMDVPSERIRVVYQGNASHDLTDPIAWLLR